MKTSNLYVNDLPALLKIGCCDPVNQNMTQLNILMYADDMVLLSNSAEGLQKSLFLLESYCHKWQLVVNTKKTKVLIFNKKSENRFTYKSEELQNVNEFKYLGIVFHKSGTFTKAIKDLACRASRAMFKLQSILKNLRTNPRLSIKLFDSVVKPIALYCSEVWGGFGIKEKKIE